MNMKVVLEYDGTDFSGFQQQARGRTVEGELKRSLMELTGEPVKVYGAGRTDAGVHALNQVVHLDTGIARSESSWVRGTNRFLPPLAISA